MILHGCLHLLGYDHEHPEDAELMEGLERRALDKVGIADPYA
jgi:probable rRNA maturation factor